MDGERKCWRMIESTLVEKKIETVKKELDLQIMNIKQTLKKIKK